MSDDGIGAAAGEAGAAAGGTSALSVIGPVESAAGIAMSIYQAHETALFRKSLLKKLAKISEQIGDLTTEFESFESLYNLKSAEAQYDNPLDFLFDNFSDLFYDNTFVKDEIAQVAVAMNNVHHLAMNDQQSLSAPLLSLMIEYLKNKSNQTNAVPLANSVVEIAYNYYMKRIIPAMFLGYSILAKEDYNPVENGVGKKPYPNLLDVWKKLLNTNNKSSLLWQLANQAQVIVNQSVKNDPNLNWNQLLAMRDQNGLPGTGFTEEQLRYVQIGNAGVVPDNHIIVGYEFKKVVLKNKDTALQLVIHHGEMNATGYVDVVTKSIQGNSTADCTTPEYYDGPLRDIRMIYTDVIEPKEIQKASANAPIVISDLYFAVTNLNFKEWRGNHYDIDVRILHLVVEFAEIQIITPADKHSEATVKLINKFKTSGQYLDNDAFLLKFALPKQHAGVQLNNIFQALEKKGGRNNPNALGFDFFNSNHNNFHLQHRSFYIPKILNTNDWNSPITGVAIRNNHLAFKSDFHKNMFNK